jgi:hypothetical protein
MTTTLPLRGLGPGGLSSFDAVDVGDTDAPADADDAWAEEPPPGLPTAS